MIVEKGAKAISESNQERQSESEERRGGGYFAIIRLSCDFLLANRLSVERKEGKEGGRWIGTASSKRGPINGNGREGRQVKVASHLLFYDHQTGIFYNYNVMLISIIG